MRAVWKIVSPLCIIILFIGFIELYFVRPQITLYPQMVGSYKKGQYLKSWYKNYVACLYNKEEAQFHHFLSKHTGLETLHDEGRMIHTTTTVIHHIKYNKRTLNATGFRGLRKVGFSKCAFDLVLTRRPSSNDPNIVIYKIHETKEAGNATKNVYRLRRDSCNEGGSLFRAMIEGPFTTSFCNNQDFFNGTYQLICKVYEDNSLLKVILTSSNFLNYARVPVKGVELFNQKMPNPFENHALHLNTGEDSISCHNKALEEPIMLENSECNTPTYSGIWVKTKNTNSGMTIAEKHWDLFVQGCPLQPMSNGTLHNCLRKFNNVILLGDSHMRYGLFHLLHKLGRLDPHVPMVLRRTYTYKQFIFRWANWPKLVAGEIKNIKNNLRRWGQKLSQSTTKPDLIIINCGHWVVGKRNIIEYVKGMEVAFEILEQFMKRRNGFVRVIWMGLFPTMDHPPFSINGWLYRRLTRIGVEPFDTSSIIYPFYEQTVCTLHYMCVNPKTGSVTGTVGPVAYDALYDYMCR